MKTQSSENKHNKLRLRRLTVADLSLAAIAGGDAVIESNGVSSCIHNCQVTSFLPGKCKKDA